MSEKTPIIMWFRHDLRLSDNPALAFAVKTKAPVICVFIKDNATLRPYGGASIWWLKQSLESLKLELQKRGVSLFTYEGETQKILASLARLVGANEIIAQRQFEPDARKLEAKVATQLSEFDTSLKLFNGYLLADPDTIKSKTGSPYKVFTPFWRECSQRLHITTPTPAPKQIPSEVKFERLIEEKLNYPKPNLEDDIGWSKKLGKYWVPGEDSAQKTLKQFLKKGLFNYSEGRDFPAIESTSKLSPHLHFGEISANQIIYKTQEQQSSKDLQDTRHFISEVGWREFNHHLLWHWPHLNKQAFQPKFNGFPWKKRNANARRWEQALTGIPIVDAGMRELWETGWMHNRVRMIVASLLVKNMLLDWKIGERWFWDTLVDANLANNTGGWQWVAGCGADAAPYFRIFNPVTQAEKFDKEASYIKFWLPELEALPPKLAVAPWTASESTLKEFNFTLGKDYPEPIVDLKTSRQEALLALEACKLASHV